MTNILILCVAIMPTTNAFAGTDKDSLHVSAKVLPYVKYDIQHQEVYLTLTQKDIDRGYKDISNATIISVKTNSVNGYLLNIFISNNIFSKVILSDGTNDYYLSEMGGEVHFMYNGRNYVTKELTFRFNLLADIKPGTYAWPVSFMIRPM